MKPQLSPPAPRPAWLRAQAALVALAQALATPSAVPAALAGAQGALREAQRALRELREASRAQVAPAVARGTLGDEDERELRHRALWAEEEAAELRRERERARQRQDWARAGHGLATGLAVLGGALLSLDSVRAALGVAQDSHLLLALGAVAVSCQVALQGLATSRRHLDEVARQYRDTARDLRERARRVEAARASAEATAATNAATASGRARLEKVTRLLQGLVDAVSGDMARGTKGQEFTEAREVLEDIAVALGTPGEGHEEVARTLEAARKALEGRGQGQGGHGGGTVTARDTGDRGDTALSLPWGPP